jgi:hypothetical protein
MRSAATCKKVSNCICLLTNSFQGRRDETHSVAGKGTPNRHVDLPTCLRKNHKIRAETGNRGFLDAAVCKSSSRSGNDLDVTEFLNFRHNSSFAIYRSLSINFGIVQFKTI